MPNTETHADETGRTARTVSPACDRTRDLDKTGFYRKGDAMSVPSKALYQALRRETHTEASLSRLQAELSAAASAAQDGKFRTYRVVISLALSKMDDGSPLSGKAVRERMTGAFGADDVYARERVAKWSNTRISQVRAVANVGTAFGIDVLSASTEQIASAWSDLDAVRRGGTKWIRAYTGEKRGDLADLLPTAVRMARETETARVEGTDEEAFDALTLLAEDARLFSALAATESRQRNAESKRDRSPVKSGEGDSPAGDPASDPGKSDGSDRPVAMSADGFTSALESLCGVQVDGWTTESHARALDMLAALTEKVSAATTDQLAKI